jgi:pimeloyl-ACP methyl ester carboxylesterase
MKKRTTFIALGGIAATIALLRRGRHREDLDWHTIEKPGRIIDIDGYGVHVVEQGAGPAMLLVHGFGGQTFQYRHQLPHFARDHRTIAVDLKGFGYSERNAAVDLSHSAQVHMLAALLERLGVERCVVVGHSMGGAVAQRFAATHPEKVDALVLAASMPVDLRRGGRAAPAFLMRPLMSLLAPVVASRLLAAGYYDPSTLTDEVRDEYMRPGRIKGSLDGLMKMMRDAASDPPVDMTRITAPVMLLYAAHDRIATLAMAQRIRARIPHARLVVIERAAHMLLEERPDECNRAIRDFLRESSSVGARVEA